MRKELGVGATPRGNVGCEYCVMSCLPEAEFRPLSQFRLGCFAGAIMVRGRPGLATQEGEDSQHSWAWILVSRALLRLRCRPGVQQFEENKIWDARLTRKQGG